jgi:hypothetical protein
VQQASNLALSPGERPGDIRFLIRDRGPDFTAPSTPSSWPPAAGSCAPPSRHYATCERLVGTLRRELVHRVLILGEAHLRAVLAEYQLHYNTAPPHQGHRPARAPDDERVAPRAAVTDVGTQQIRRKPILNGLINEYTHAAWRTEDLQVTQPNPIFERDTGKRPTATDDDPTAAASSTRPGHPAADLSEERVRRRPVLGGLINEYERVA